MVKAKHNTNFYFIMAFFLSLILFVSGISIGFLLDNLKAQDINSNLQEIEESLKEAETELLLMDYFEGNFSCDYLMFKSADLGERAQTIGENVVLFEASNQVNLETYISLKKEYMRILLNNWLTLENIKESCNANYSTILYFYNNNECPDCENQGYVLSYYKNLMKENLMIFSLDAGLNMSSIDLLKYNYNITTYPALVVDGEVYEGFLDSTSLGQILFE